MRMPRTLAAALAAGVALATATGAAASAQPAASPPAAAAAAPNADPARLRAIVEAGRRRNRSRAVEFGMWVGDREIAETALGTSMTTLPATTGMHYRIGGIAETMMSTLLLMLVEQGRIRLDDRLSRWMPQVLNADKVTVRMLAGNTAGYVDYVRVDAFLRRQLADPFHTFSDDELIGYATRGGRMNFAPGTRQAYSHTDNVLLGQVIQRATGESMKALYERNIFGPMRLTETSFPVDQTIPPPVLHAFTSDRRVYEDCTYWNPFWGSTPGLPISTVRDIGRWGRIFGTGRLISRAHFHEQIGRPSVASRTPGSATYFAYGVAVTNGWLVQNPSINGYSGAFAYNLATGTTIVVEATKNPTTTNDGAAFTILQDVVKYVTPASPLGF